jgi:putative transposase
MEWEAVAKMVAICYKYGISKAICYKWKAKYAWMTISALRRLKTAVMGNSRLRQIVTEQALDKWILKDLLSTHF